MSINPISSINTGMGSYQFEAIRAHQEASSFQSALESAQNNLQNLDDYELRHATREFEAFFINMLFRQMRQSTGNEHSLIPKSNAEQIFQEMLDEEKSRIAADSGGIGLADMMFRQLRQQNVNVIPAPPTTDPYA